VNGTPFTLNFTASDTQAKVIDKVPTGATLSAHAEFTLADAWGTNGLGTPLIAETPGTTSTREGDNTVMMYVQYPLECNLSSGLPGDVSIIGTPPAYYTNASPTALPSATESYISGDGITMHFAGWATSDGGTAAISSSIPNDGSYKGHLTLYAVYSSCTVSINPGDSWGSTTPIIAEGDHLALTPVPAGFPSAPTYTWEVLSPAADAPVTVSSSGVVSPVEGASGNATIKVTATCGALTATATQPVTVAAFSLDCNSTEVLVKGGTDKGITASVAGYTGSDIEYNWNVSASPDPANPVVTGYEGGTGSSRTFTPAAGGTVTVTVSARLTNTNKYLPAKEVTLYVLDLALSGGTALNAPTVPGGNYSLTMATTDTAGKGVTASLNGLSGVSGVTYTWTAGSSAADKIEFTGSSTDASRTIKPKNAGTAAFTVTASLGGVSTSATVDVSVAGIVFADDFPKSIELDGSGTTTALTASVVGFSGSVSWGAWVSSDTSVASFPLGGASSGGSTTIGLLPSAGGKTEISLTATVGGTTLTAKKDIYVLELELTSSATSGFSAPTASTDGSLLLTTADTTATTVTATLKGLPAADVTYSWTPTTSTRVTATGTSTSILTVAPKTGGTVGTEPFTVTATYDGESISQSLSVTVAGIVLTTCPKYIEMGGATDQRELTAEVQGFTGTPSNWTWTSGTATAANFVGTSTDSGSSSTKTLSGIAGGKTKITVTADVDGKTLKAEQYVYILDLTLTCADTSFAQPTDIVDPTYKLTLASSETTGTTVTANLAGFTDGFTYTWTPSTSTKMDVSFPGSGSRILSVKPKTGSTGGTESFIVKATCTADDTIYIEKTVAVTVAGLELTGSSALEFNSAPDAPAGANDIALTLVVNGVSSTALSGVTYTSSDTTVAADPTAGTGGCTVTALKGGITTITVTATTGGKELSATKKISVINFLVTDGDGNAVPATGNSITTGSTMSLSASFEGLEGGDFAWSASPTGIVSFSPADAASTTVGTIDFGNTTVTLTATYDGTNYTKTLGFGVGLDISGLSEYLANLPTGSKESPNVLPPIVGLTTTNWTQLKTLLTANSTKFVDLSATELPEGIITMTNGFKGCVSLVKPPKIPSTVTNMNGCFENCRNMTTASNIPDGVTTLRYTFSSTALTDASSIRIPDQVTDIYGFFSMCQTLTKPPMIPENVTCMSSCFAGCKAIIGDVIIKAKITENNNADNVFTDDFFSLESIIVYDATTRSILQQQVPNYLKSKVVAP